MGVVQDGRNPQGAPLACDYLFRDLK
jgi:hypothetical protein